MRKYTASLFNNRHRLRERSPLHQQFSEHFLNIGITFFKIQNIRVFYKKKTLTPRNEYSYEIITQFLQLLDRRGMGTLEAPHPGSENSCLDFFLRDFNVCDFSVCEAVSFVMIAGVGCIVDVGVRPEVTAADVVAKALG